MSARWLTYLVEQISASGKFQQHVQPWDCVFEPFLPLIHQQAVHEFQNIDMLHGSMNLNFLLQEFDIFFRGYLHGSQRRIIRLREKDELNGRDLAELSIRCAEDSVKRRVSMETLP